MTTKSDVHSSTAALYLPADFYLIRTPALSAHTFQHLSSIEPEEDISTAHLSSWLQAQCETTQQRLLEMSAHPQIEQAICVASASLHESLVQVRRGVAHPNRAKKALSSLLRYLIRMSTRPTPFGLFSGVALGFFGEETRGQLATPAIQRFRTRPDMNWLLAVLKQIETSPSVVRQLTVQTNQLAVIAGGRVYLSTTDPYGQQRQEAVSLRTTPVVRKALDLARFPLPYITLHDALLQAFSPATTQQVERLLWQLWEHGLLISTLHPPLTNAQPTQYLYQQLATLSDVEETQNLLREVLTLSTASDTIGIGGNLGALKELVQTQQTLVPGEKQQQHIQVDSLLALQSPTLSTSVGTAAARAAELLLRLTPLPHGIPGLQEYRQQFLEKYGLNAEVPLLELLSPELGLGPPPAYTQPLKVPHANAFPQNSTYGQRERLLLRLMQDALNNHSLEVVLDEAHLATLETWKPRLEQAPRSLEIYLQIQASSREAMDRGEVCAVVSPNPGAPGGGCSFGRFVDLLGEPALQALQRLLGREEALEPECIFAELSYQHSHARTSNVALRPWLRPYEIAVGVTPSGPVERVILLQDLVVGIRDDRFYLRSQRLNKRVIVSQLHMLNFSQAPHVCRFLLEIASDGVPLLSSFNWGSLSTAPFLPRITVRQTPSASLVLSPACWNLEATTIQPQGTGTSEDCLFQGLQHWRQQWRVPRYIYLTEADNRLLLDLENPLMVAELCASLKRLKAGQHITLQELLPDFEHLWLTDGQGAPYFSEIVIPLLRRDAFEPRLSQAHQANTDAVRKNTPLQTSVTPSHAVTQQVRVFYPGDAWNYVKLYCTPAQQEEIIAGPLCDIVQQLRERELIDRWFFLRYADPQPHLRLRIHAHAIERSQPALDVLLSWSHQLATRGLIQRFVLDTYEREVARYGGPAAIDVLEEIFSVDSDICMNIIAAQYTHRLTLEPLAIAVVSLDRFFAVWGYDRGQRLQWLQKRTEQYTFRKQFYPKRKHYCELLTSWEKDGDAELTTQRTLLDELMASLEVQLPPLVTQIRHLAQTGKLWGTEEDLLASLAHMQKVRLLDLDTHKEQQMYAFWRYTLESIQLRKQ